MCDGVSGSRPALAPFGLARRDSQTRSATANSSLADATDPRDCSLDWLDKLTLDCPHRPSLCACLSERCPLSYPCPSSVDLPKPAPHSTNVSLPHSSPASHHQLPFRLADPPLITRAARCGRGSSLGLPCLVTGAARSRSMHDWPTRTRTSHQRVSRFPLAKKPSWAVHPGCG